MERCFIALILIAALSSRAFPQSLSPDHKWEVTAGSWFVVKNIKTGESQGLDVIDTTITDGQSVEERKPAILEESTRLTAWVSNSRLFSFQGNLKREYHYSICALNDEQKWVTITPSLDLTPVIPGTDVTAVVSQYSDRYTRFESSVFGKWLSNDTFTWTDSQPNILVTSRITSQFKQEDLDCEDLNLWTKHASEDLREGPITISGQVQLANPTVHRFVWFLQSALTLDGPQTPVVLQPEKGGGLLDFVKTDTTGHFTVLLVSSGTATYHRTWLNIAGKVRCLVAPSADDVGCDTMISTDPKNHSGTVTLSSNPGVTIQGQVMGFSQRDIHVHIHCRRLLFYDIDKTGIALDKDGTFTWKHCPTDEISVSVSDKDSDLTIKSIEANGQPVANLGNFCIPRSIPVNLKIVVDSPLAQFSP